MADSLDPSSKNMPLVFQAFKPLATPIVCTGGVRNFALAEQWLLTAFATSSARQSLADPDWAMKICLGGGDALQTC